jgi:hypothetical protein
MCVHENVMSNLVSKSEGVWVRTEFTTNLSKNDLEILRAFSRLLQDQLSGCFAEKFPNQRSAWIPYLPISPTCLAPHSLPKSRNFPFYDILNIPVSSRSFVLNILFWNTHKVNSSLIEKLPRATPTQDDRPNYSYICPNLHRFSK